MRTPISRYHSEIGAKKYIKGPGNVHSMENRFNETGADFGKTQCEPKLRNNERTSHSTFSKEQIDELRAKWPEPEEILKLNTWLLECVNSKEEYDLLQEEIAEVKFLMSLSSQSLRGGGGR